MQANALETALRDAATDEASRPAFFRLLMASSVWVAGQEQGAEPGPQAQPTAGKLAIQHWQKKDGSGAVVPFFTSEAALQRVLPGGHPTIRLPARELFTLTRGASLILDPMSEHSKDFYPDEVEALLAADDEKLAEPPPAPEPERSIKARLRAWLGRGKPGR